MLKDSRAAIKQRCRVDLYETKWEIEGIGGTGTIDCIDVYPGVQVIYNHFHSFDSPPHSHGGGYHLEINHCLRGKYECLYNRNSYAYVSEGDLSVSKWSLERESDGFPMGYYEGVEILIDIEKAGENTLFSEFHIHLEELVKKLEANDNLFILKANSRIEHICLEMYEVEEQMKVDYLKIKVLELLLFLSYQEFQWMNNQKKYYPRKQVEQIKAVKDFLVGHLAEKPDFDALASRHHMSVHFLRKAFKEIYGLPIYQWLKKYRLEYSLELLKNTDLPIIEIASRIGYSNPSKYAAAFDQRMKMTPGQYRKSCGRMD